MPESRFVAAAFHLIISASIFLLIACFVYFFLLPGFLFYTEGGTTILSLIAGVDVVLGPLITLIIYKKTKPEIKFDLSVIALIQIAALTYGLFSLWSSRPLAVFYTQGTYHITYTNSFSEADDIKAIQDFHKIKTPTIAISVPEDTVSVDALLLTHRLNTGSDYFLQDNLYTSYQDQIPKLKDFAISPQKAVDKLIVPKESPLAKLKETEFGFFRYTNGSVSGYMVLDLNTGDFIQLAR